LFEGAEYPDQGAHVEVWINNYPYYLEVEVVGPMVELKANGGRTTFTEDWWAAKVKGPILNVNRVGATGKALALEAITFKGVYGVFWVGNAQLNLLDNVGNIVAQGQNHAVMPFETFNLDETLPVPNNAAKAELRVLKTDGTVIGALDTLDLTGAGVAISDNSVKPTHFSLLQNYPNPFNPKTTIQFILSERSQAAIKIFDVNGKEVATIFCGELSAGVHSFLWNAELNASGVYFAHVQVNSINQSIKMLLLK
jgi:flagellar hook assembly protein FlgD